LTAAATRGNVAAEMQLMQEDAYRSLFENAVCGLFRLSPGGRILALNPAMARIMGYDSPRDAMDRVSDISTQVLTDPARRWELMERLLREGSIQGAEAAFKRPDGGQILVKLHLLLVRDHGGKPSHIEGSCLEAPVLDVAIETLRRNEERLHGITSNMPGFVYQFYATTDGAYGISYASEQLPEIFGITADLDSLFPEFLSHVHDEDRERFIGSIRAATQRAPVARLIKEVRHAAVWRARRGWPRGLPPAGCREARRADRLRVRRGLSAAPRACVSAG